MNRYTFTIDGQEYSVVSDEPKEYLQQIEKYVNAKINELLQADARMNAHTASVLACITLTDELFKGNEASDHIRKQTAGYIDELSRARDEIRHLTQEVSKLKKQV